MVAKAKKSAPAQTVRHISDPRTMRALAHPTRIALLEVLLAEGSATATRCAELLGDTPASCSFHLRQLAKYGYVEPAPGGTGRQRPWRLPAERQHFDDVPNDEEGTAATAALMRIFMERELQRAVTYAEESRREPAEWRNAAFFMGTLTWVTPAELQQLSDDVVALFAERYADRARDPKARPDDARPVRLLASGYPVTRWG